MLEIMLFIHGKLWCQAVLYAILKTLTLHFFYSCIIIVLAVFYIYIFTEIYVTQQNYLSESQSEQKLKIHTFPDT